MHWFSNWLSCTAVSGRLNRSETLCGTSHLTELNEHASIIRSRLDEPDHHRLRSTSHVSDGGSVYAYLDTVDFA
jgi:hypothetical protein